MDVSNILSSIQARLTKLESFHQSSMTLLSRTLTETPLNSFATVSFVSQWTWINATASPLFSLIRPQTVFITSSMSYVTNGGTANYGFVRCGLAVAGTLTPPSNDINGVPMVGPYGTVSNGSGWTNFSAPFCFVAPAGAYYAIWGYNFNAGATTTLSYGPTEIDVFVLDS